MKIFTSILLFGVTLAVQPVWPQSLGSNVSLRTGSDQKQVITALQKDLPLLMKEADLPGLSIALIRNSEVVWHQGFGVKDSKSKEPVGDNTVFEAASLSKPVFAYAVLQLVDSGKLDLDTPLQKYLPGDYDVGPDPRLGLITARHVLSHTTGFPNWRQQSGLKIFFTPGEKFSYSGEGFVYLAKVVERITGEELNNFLRRTVFQPLQMSNSSFIWEAGYEQLKTSRHNSMGEPTEQFKTTTPNAASTLHTTALDYGRFVVAILKGTGLKKETLKQMLTTQVKVDESGSNMTNRPANKPSDAVSWGLGWGLQNTRDGLSFWHWGDNGNAKAYIVAFNRQKLGAVVFANGDNGLSFMPELISRAVGGEQPALSWIKYESYKSPARLLLKDIIARGAEPALHDYSQSKRGRPASDLVTASQMNRLGYTFLYGVKRPKDAIAVFKLNVEDYPQSSNTYDSLGEGYMVNGDKELAIKNYERSIELDPKNTNGVDQLKKLREGKKE
jgi:CubicO group peptidase (beta-lactamase class C family)